MLSKQSLLALARSLVVTGTAASLITACSGGATSQPSVLPQTEGVPKGAPVTAQSSTSPAYSIVQHKHAGAAYNSTLKVQLSQAPAAGHVLVLFFEENKSASFPYSGQVTWPAAASGAQWSYDGGTTSTAILHHVVQSGETGTYTLNVGGTGSGYADYMVVEVAGASTSNPVNGRLLHAVAPSTTQFTFGSGITPTAAGTLPLAFFSAHASGRTWSAVSSGWTAVDRNADYTEMVAQGPVQTGTAAVNATATLSSGSTYTGSADVVLLNPASATSTPAPISTPTASPAPVPTATPAASGSAPSSYIYHGIPIYTANDWFTTDLAQGGSAYAVNTVDANSANILNNLHSIYGNIKWYSSTDTISVNISSTATPTKPVLSDGVQGSASPMNNDPYNDNPNQVIPITSPLYEQGAADSGSTNAHCNGDCHVIVLNPQTGVTWEAYRSGVPNWNGTSFVTGYGETHNVKYPFNDQYNGAKCGTVAHCKSNGGSITAAGLPNLGKTDLGEDAAGASTCNDDGTGSGCIHHIIGMMLPQPSVASGSFVAPATAGQSACTSYCTYQLPVGARLRLHASFVCPSASVAPQAHLVCVQLKHYGAIVDDFQGGSFYGLRFGESSDGSNPWHGDSSTPSSDLGHILAVGGANYIHITDFDVMTLGTIH